MLPFDKLLKNTAGNLVYLIMEYTLSRFVTVACTYVV
jgi:hypothetical protein